MSFLSKLFKSPSSRSTTDKQRPQICLVDAAGLLETGNRGKSNTGAPSPRELFNTLRSLAEFASREHLAMFAFMTGRPLREASDGGSFKGVKVHYSESAEGIAKMMLAQIPALLQKNEVIVITASPELEKAAYNAGASCMRAVTFRKALEDKGEARGERDPKNAQSQRHSNGHNNHQRRRQQGQNQPATQPKNQASSSGEDGPANGENERPQNEGIQSLIDPL